MAYAPTSYAAMRMRLQMLLEQRKFTFESFTLIDPGLAASRQILMHAELQGSKLAAFVAAADSGDIATLLQLGRLPDMPVAERWEQPLILRLLYGMLRREYVLDITSREMGKLNALLRKIDTSTRAYGTLGKLMAAIPLGDPIGCLCESAEGHWHSDGNRFDLIAYDILNVNGLRLPVATSLEQRVPAGVEPSIAAEWAKLLQDDNPYPAWKE